MSGTEASGARLPLIRTRSEARRTVALYAAAAIALVAAIFFGRGAAVVFMSLMIVILVQSQLVWRSRIRRPQWERRQAELPDDDFGYFLTLLKPYPPRESLRAFPPGLLIAAIRFLRAREDATASAESSRSA